MPRRLVFWPLCILAWLAVFASCDGGTSRLQTRAIATVAEDLIISSQLTDVARATGTAAVATATASVRETAIAGQTATARVQTATADADRVRTFATIEAEFTATALAAQHATGTAEAAARTAQAAQTATARAVVNRPPVIRRFTAEFVPADRTTYYEVFATDPDAQPNERLKYVWSSTNVCGAFAWDQTEQDSPEADWYHPHPPCPDETFHPATITVIVTDAAGNTATYAYTSGSASGTVELPPP
jgi:hypothetical protein